MTQERLEVMYRGIHAEAVTAAHRELLTLHELVAHRMFQLLVGAHRGRTYSM